MTSQVVVVTGVICTLWWLIAYAGIIHRGFRDRTYGMPIVALGANLSWEAAYGLFINPFADHIHTLSIAWLVVDLVILWQACRYAPREFRDLPSVARYARFLPLIAVVVAYPIVYLGFFEFHDPDGEYTGFGVNCLMSVLFLVLLVRRDSPRGQSLYIAIAKFFGTFFAWLATALTVTTSTTQAWPDSFWSFWADSVRHNSYPLTPLINYLYLVVFVADIIYTVALYRRLKAADIRPWRHI
ncbi:hypothetical protein [Actinoplanes sp. HUAS TT8]|uniref:transmembrane-type terpene cyclase n=1 Tax=Actinoplanes sp. HUAS TT8 TaxID=3447453 RepID=UPI003F5266E2